MATAKQAATKQDLLPLAKALTQRTQQLCVGLEQGVADLYNSAVTGVTNSYRSATMPASRAA